MYILYHMYRTCGYVYVFNWNTLYYTSYINKYIPLCGKSGANKIPHHTPNAGTVTRLALL